MVSKTKGHIKLKSLENPPCQARLTLVNTNFNKPLHLLWLLTSGSCNTVDDSYAGVYFPDKVKNMNVQVFNLMSMENETRFLLQHGPCDRNMDWMTVYVIQNKSGTMVSVDVIVKN